MNFKKIFVLIIILVSLLFGIYLANKKKEKMEESKIIVNLKSDEINKIELREGKRKIVIGKEGKNWKILSPIKTNADEIIVERIVDDFAELKPEKIVDKNPSDLKKYGLSNPERGITLYSEKGKKYTLLFGDKGPLGDEYYAKLDNSTEVVLLSSNKRDDIMKDVKELRDKHILKVETEDVKGFIVDNKKDKKLIELKRDGERWFFLRPEKCLASESKIDDILFSIQNLEAKDILKDSPSEKDLAEYNLNSPELEVEVKEKDGTKKIIVAKKGEDYYAFSKDSNFIAKIDSTFVDDVSKEFKDLREKKVAVFSGYEINKIELSFKGKYYLMEKDQNGTWRVKKPEKFILQDEKVSDLISALEELESKEIIDTPLSLKDYGLDKPSSKVKLFPEDGKPIIILFGKETDNDIYVMNKEFSYIFKVGKDILDKFPKKSIIDWKFKENKKEED